MTKIEMKSKGAALRSSEKKHRRLFSAAVVLLICSLALVGTASADEYVAKIGENSYTTLSAAVNAATDKATPTTITLLQDVTLEGKLTITGNVIIDGNDWTITRADTYTGTLFTVDTGATLNLTGNLTIDGGNKWEFNQGQYESDLRLVDAGTTVWITADTAEKYFTLQDGSPHATEYMISFTGGSDGGVLDLHDVTIRNHYSRTGKGIVNAGTYTTVNLKGATITHCANPKGSGLVVNANGAGIQVNMEGGTSIYGNHVGSNHGLFRIYSGTVFTMNGGTITHNTGCKSNGVVVGVFSGTFIMNGGVISYNSCVPGDGAGRNAAIYLHSGSIMKMSGGEISHNVGRARGGIDSRDSSQSLTITGGSVEDNVSLSGYPDADVGGDDSDAYGGIYSVSRTISGGTFTQDVGEWCVPGYVPTYNVEEDNWTVQKGSPTFKMTVINSAASSVASAESISLTKSIEWGSENVASGQTANLKVSGDWKQDSNVVITYPISLIVNSEKILILNRGIFEIGCYADTEATTASPAVFGNLTISGGNYQGGENGMALVKYGSLNITGGTFTNKSATTPLLRIDVDAFDASITVTGGTFIGFNPKEFVPTGYKSVNTKENTWTVKKVYSITVTASEGGTACASVSSATEGDEVTLTVTPEDGYSFKEWGVSVGEVTITDRKFTMPDSDVSVNAVFERNQEDNPESDPEIDPEITPTPGNNSGGGNGDGGYESHPRTTANGGFVDFGKSRVIKAVILPEGSSGSVVLKVDPIGYWPKKLDTEYTFDISVEKLGDGMSYILFEIPESTLTRLGLTASYIGASHLVDGDWILLKTTYEEINGVLLYTTETETMGEFKLIIEEGASSPKPEEVLPPIDEPTDEPVDEPETPKTPAPILAVIAGLGAAVLLRRK